MSSPNNVTAWFERLFEDVRYALRGFARTPAFTVAAIATIALGIGSTTTVFSFVDRILFRNLPYPTEERLVSVGMLASLDANEFFTGEDYRKWRAAQTPFESMTALAAVAGSSMTSGVNPGGNCDVTDENPVRVNCAYVDSNFLSTFGIQPLFGHDFSESDVNVPVANVTLLAYSFWKSHFQGAAEVLGKTISIDGHPSTIIGILPAAFEMPNLGTADLLVPLTSKSAFVRAFAKLRPGINMVQARQAVEPLFQDTLASSLVASVEGREKIRLQLRSLRDRQVQDVRTASYVLFSAVLLVLIVACTNVANLMLARATARDREFAVRRALGAGLGRLVRQTLTESLLVSLTGGLGGLAIAYSLMHVFVALAPQSIPRLNQANLDGRVILFAAVISIATGIFFGAAPSLHVPDGDMLRTRTVGISRSRFHQFLVVAQIALSVVLVSGSVLLMRTLWNLERVPLGMSPQHVTIVSIRLPKDRYAQGQQQTAFFEELETRLQAFPSAWEYALADAIPPGGLGAMSFPSIHVEGQPNIDPAAGGVVGFRHITPAYFSVLGIPLLRGRVFNESDRRAGPGVVILSDALARRLFATADPVGKHVRFGDDKEWMTVLGVVANVKNNPSLTGADDPEWYFPQLRGTSPYLPPQTNLFGAVLLRSDLEVGATSQAIRKLIAGIDPALPITIETMPQRLAQLTDRPRFTAALLSAFAIAAVLLAAVGLSGVLSFIVIQRTQEIGVRMALGASGQSVVRLILGYALRWSLLGIAFGIGLSLVALGAIRTLLFQVPQRDPWTLAVTSVVLVIVALVAACIPSHRASNIDPIVALRHD